MLVLNVMYSGLLYLLGFWLLGEGDQIINMVQDFALYQSTLISFYLVTGSELHIFCIIGKVLIRVSHFCDMYND